MIFRTEALVAWVSKSVPSLLTMTLSYIVSLCVLSTDLHNKYRTSTFFCSSNSSWECSFHLGNYANQIYKGSLSSATQSWNYMLQLRLIHHGWYPFAPKLPNQLERWLMWFQKNLSLARLNTYWWQSLCQPVITWHLSRGPTDTRIIHALLYNVRLIICSRLIFFPSVRFVTLTPGDVFLTGTPPGVGVFRQPPVFLKVN